MRLYTEIRLLLLLLFWLLLLGPLPPTVCAYVRRRQASFVMLAEKKCREDKAYQNNLKNLEMKRLLSAMGSFENHLNETAVGSFCRSLFGDCGVCVPVPGHASVWFWFKYCVLTCLGFQVAGEAGSIRGKGMIGIWKWAWVELLWLRGGRKDSMLKRYVKSKVQQLNR